MSNKNIQNPLYINQCFSYPNDNNANQITPNIKKLKRKTLIYDDKWERSNTTMLSISILSSVFSNNNKIL